VDVLARTQEGGGGFGCARALAAGSNVVADVVACSNDGAMVAEQAAAVVNMILAKIGT
jgi:PknH-like extracellular domain